MTMSEDMREVGKEVVESAVGKKSSNLVSRLIVYVVLAIATIMVYAADSHVRDIAAVVAQQKVDALASEIKELREIINKQSDQIDGMRQDIRELKTILREREKRVN